MWAEFDRAIFWRSRKDVFTHETAPKRVGTRSRIRHNIASGNWYRWMRGVYFEGPAPVPFEVAVQAAHLHIGERAVASHRLAASLHRLEGFNVRELEFTAPTDCRFDVPPEVILHHSDVPPNHRTHRFAITTTTLARTIVDLFETCDDWRALVMAYEDNHRRGERARQDLWRVMHELPQRKKAFVRLNELFSRRGIMATPTESPWEAVADDIMWRNGFRPERQHRLFDDEDCVARFDFAFLDLRLAVEIDGEEPHRKRFYRDRFRDTDVRTLDWEVARFTVPQLCDERTFVNDLWQIHGNRRRLVTPLRVGPMPTIQTVFDFESASPWPALPCSTP